MFLETVNKNTPGKLRFKVIENSCPFLTNPKVKCTWVKFSEVGSHLELFGQVVERF